MASQAVQPTPDEDTDRLRILLDAGATVADPERIPGLLDKVPLDRRIVRGTSYNTKVTIQRKVRCKACLKQTPHYHGFVVEFEDGSKGLVGRDCGESHFFEQGQWKEMLADDRSRIRQALYEGRSESVVIGLHSLIPTLMEWSHDLEEFDRVVGDFRARFPKLLEELTSVARRGGELYYDAAIQVPHTRGGKAETYTQYVRQRIGSITAPWLLKGPNLGREVARIAQRMTRVAADLRDGQQTLMEAEAAAVEIRKVKARLAEIAVLQENAIRFFADGPMEIVAKWGRQNINSTMRYKRGRLHADLSDGYEISHRVPTRAELPSPRWSAISELWPQL